MYVGKFTMFVGTSCAKELFVYNIQQRGGEVVSRGAQLTLFTRKTVRAHIAVMLYGISSNSVKPVKWQYRAKLSLFYTLKV